MYTCKYSLSVYMKILAAQKKSPSIIKGLEKLRDSPRSIAIPTSANGFGEFYINCNRYSILIDIDDRNNCINIVAILLHTTLYKILTGRITKLPNS